jgi:hypothetical protein
VAGRLTCAGFGGHCVHALAAQSFADSDAAFALDNVDERRRVRSYDLQPCSSEPFHNSRAASVSSPAVIIQDWPLPSTIVECSKSQETG